MSQADNNEIGIYIYNVCQYKQHEVWVIFENNDKSFQNGIHINLQHKYIFSHYFVSKQYFVEVRWTLALVLVNNN